MTNEVWIYAKTEGDLVLRRAFVIQPEGIDFDVLVAWETNEEADRLVPAPDEVATKGLDVEPLANHATREKAIETLDFYIAGATEDEFELEIATTLSSELVRRCKPPLVGYWLLNSVTPIEPHLSNLKQMLAAKCQQVGAEQDLSQGILFRSSRTTLTLGKGIEANCFSDRDLFASGHIRKSDTELLVLLAQIGECLGVKPEVTGPEGKETGLEFGAYYRLVKSVAERLGLDTEQLRDDAEKLCFVAPLINLVEIRSESADLFF